MTMRVTDTSGPRRAFEVQAEHCNRMDAPFTARLCLALLEVLDDTTALGRRVIGWPRENAVGDLVPLRCCAGLHHLAREGRVPALSAIYPPAACSDETLRQTLIAAIEREDAFLTGYLDSPPQTNEVGRSAILLGGLLRLAEQVPMPFALYEIGASAGLNMSFERWRYDLGEAGSLGSPDARVTIASAWTGNAPSPETPVMICARAASDLAPLDPGKPTDRERLLSYIWAEQADRLVRIEAALDVAAKDGLRVENADARAWMRDALAAGRAQDGTCTVLFHSVFIQYLDPPVRAALIVDIFARGAAATEQKPFAWLRMEAAEQDKARCELRLTLWPGGVDRALADVNWHGRSAHWR